MASADQRQLPTDEFGYDWPQLAETLEQLRGGVLALGADAAHLSPLVERIRRQTTAMHAHVQVMKAASARPMPLRLVHELDQLTGRAPALVATGQAGPDPRAAARNRRTLTSALVLGATLTLALNRARS